MRRVPKWKTRGGQYGVRAGVDGGRRSARRAPAPPEAITGIGDLAAYGADQLEVEAVLGAVGVHRVEQDLAGAELGGARRPLDGVEAGGLAAAVGGHLEAGVGARRRGGRRRESTSTWLPNRSAISATSSGRWIAAVLTATLSAPARSSRSTSSTEATPPPTVSGMKTSSARARHDLHRRGAALVGGGDVEEGQLVGTLGVVGAGQLDRVAGVAQLLEVDALDHPAAVDVQARDHADGERHAAPLA